MPTGPLASTLTRSIFLSAVLALEAVLLTSFVLIRQNTMDQRSERRNHLDLQINLLAEKEATSILHKLDAIAAKFGVEFPQDLEATELAKDTQVESIARDLRVQERQRRRLSLALRPKTKPPSAPTWQPVPLDEQAC